MAVGRGRRSKRSTVATGMPDGGYTYRAFWWL